MGHIKKFKDFVNESKKEIEDFINGKPLKYKTTTGENVVATVKQDKALDYLYHLTIKDSKGKVVGKRPNMRKPHLIEFAEGLFKLGRVNEALSIKTDYKDLDKDEQVLLNKCKSYSDDTLLSWAGYDSKAEWEEATDEKFNRPALIMGNYQDILSNLKELGK